MSVKNSILIVSWSNELRRTGKNIQTATMTACKLRFRAIIMSSASTCLSVLHLIIGNPIGPSAGESARLAIGGSIFGGIFLSTITTLYVTPTMYMLLTKNIKPADSTEVQLNRELKLNK